MLTSKQKNLNNIPLYYCEGEEGVFVIICRSRDLPEGHGVTVSRYSVPGHFGP